MSKYVVLSLEPDHGRVEPKVYYVGSYVACQEFINDFVDRIWAENCDAALEYTLKILHGLDNKTPCGNFHYDVYVGEELWFVDQENVDDYVEDCVTGEWFVDFLEQRIPNFKLVQVNEY